MPTAPVTVSSRRMLDNTHTSFQEAPPGVAGGDTSSVAAPQRDSIVVASSGAPLGHTPANRSAHPATPGTSRSRVAHRATVLQAHTLVAAGTVLGVLAGLPQAGAARHIAPSPAPAPVGGATHEPLPVLNPGYFGLGYTGADGAGAYGWYAPPARSSGAYHPATSANLAPIAYALGAIVGGVAALVGIAFCLRAMFGPARPAVPPAPPAPPTEVTPCEMTEAVAHIGDSVAMGVEKDGAGQTLKNVLVVHPAPAEIELT